MRILADRHHADLLYSLQRLFEDRLGGELYVPVGMEWWDADVWRFGKDYFHDARLANQYLALNEQYTEIEPGLYETYDQAHPDRLIRAATLGWFRAHEFDFVMATVADNAQGFAQEARMTGSQYLYHIGNQSQQLPAFPGMKVILTTTQVLPEGIPSVTMHQEFDSGPGQTYDYAEPGSAYTIRNFVNSFQEFPGYAAFLQAEERLPTFTFTTHGHGSRDEYVNGVEKVAAMMRSAGWAWQDKPIHGEGFGHVIHAWAAVGRPLIGHASYYSGKLAEPLWHDGVTCIDLDQHSLEEAVWLIAEISNDPGQHTFMCESIRAEFDALVDYPAEAAAVASMLGL